MNEILNLFLKQILAFIISFIAGHLFLVFYKREKIDYNFKNIFINLFVANLFFAIISAIIKCHFISIWIIPIPPFLWFLYTTVSKEKLTISSFQIKYNPRLLILLGLIIASSCFWYSFYFINHHQFTESHCDFNFYANISKGLWNTGVETHSSVFYQFQIPNKPFIYHYLEIWLNGFWYHVCGISSYESLLFITYPLTFVIAILSIAMFIENKFKNPFYTIVVSVIISSSIGFYIPKIMTHEIFWNSYSGWNLISFYGQKLLFAYPFAILALYFYFKKNYFPLILVLFCLLISHISLIFLCAYCFFIISILLALSLYNKTIKIRNFKPLFILLLYFFATYMIFYLIQAKDVNLLGDITIRKLRPGIFNYFETIINLTLKTIPLVIILIVFFFQLKRFHIIISILLFSILLINIPAAFINLYDACQFIYTAFPIIVLILFLIIIKTLTSKKLLIAIMILLPFSIYNIASEKYYFKNKWFAKMTFKHSPDYVNKCITFLNHPNEKYLYIAGNPPLLTQLFPNKPTTFSARFTYASDSYDFSYYINDDTLTYYKFNDLYVPNPYSDWKLKHNAHGKNQDVIFNYLLDNHINFVFVDSKEKVPLWFLNKFNICCKDKFSGDYLLKLK